jgi:hypothetical protein
MSYCDPSWVSDYTYIGLYNDQQIYGHAPEQTAVTSMIVTAGLSESGALGLSSTYAFNAVPSRETGDSDYQVELLDVAGQVIARHEMQLREVEEETISAKMLMAVVPLPSETAVSLQIVSGNGAVRAAQPLASAQLTRSLTAVASQEGDNINLSWSAADTPAIVRYTPDGGESWFGLGVELLGGEFSVPANDLPAGENAYFEIILANTGSPAVLTAVMP